MNASELIRRFDARVAAAPDATAVVDGGRSASYRRIAELSSLHARLLADSGARPGDVVALACDRSIEWVVAMLAVLRMGGVYLPLPPDLPRERRLLLSREAGVRHLLRHPSIQNDLDATDVVVAVDEKQPTPAADTPATASPGPADDRACVLFTSGSTGTPKGVVVRQSSIVRLVTDTDYVSIAADDAMAFASNTAFDAATFEAWGALLSGARLIVIPTATLLSPSAMETAVRSHGITILFLTTELFNRIARARPTALRSLRWLLFGGEKASVECVRAVVESGAPPANLLHMYGPTECTTFTTCARVASIPAGASSVPIGEPISGWKVFLLDERLHDVADGDEGELCIAGAGLAEGYLGRPDETAAAFVTLQCEGRAERVYRSGDLARRRDDGQLEFVGRRDGQIKLRGFRIETGEIEAVLARHPAVRDAVVVVYPGPGEAPRLGACLVMAGAAGARELAAVRDFVAERLPAPMVPAILRVHDTFPLTPSKKIDRQRLLADLRESDASPGADESAGTFVAADAVERKLAAIWQGVLGRPPRHGDEGFFEAGGDSLQAVDFQLRVENEWKIALSPSALIETPSFRGLAGQVRSWRAPDVRPVVWFTPAERRPVLACVPGVYGHVFFFRNLAAFWPEDRGLCALPSRYLDPAADGRLLTVEEIAEENLARLETAGVGPIEAVAGYSFGGMVALEMARRIAERDKPPTLILYDTAAEGEEFRGMTPLAASRAGWRRVVRQARFHAYRHLTRLILGLGGRIPARSLNPAAVASVLALESYRPRPYDGGMLLIRSSVEQPTSGIDAETMGWGRLVRGTLTVSEVAALHDDLFRPPHVAEVAAITIDYLRKGTGS